MAYAAWHDSAYDTAAFGILDSFRSVRSSIDWITGLDCTVWVLLFCVRFVIRSALLILRLRARWRSGAFGLRVRSWIPHVIFVMGAVVRLFRARSGAVPFTGRALLANAA